MFLRICRENHWIRISLAECGDGGDLNPKIIPRRKGALLPEVAAGRLCQGSAQGARVPGVESWLLVLLWVTVWAKRSPRQSPVHISTWPASGG